MAARYDPHTKLWRDVDSQYRVGQKLGAGGQGTVYKATRRRDNRIVVVKSMKDPPTTEDTAGHRMPTEAYILKKLPPNSRCVEFKHALWDERANTYAVFFGLEDGDLVDLMQAHYRRETWLPESFLYHLLFQGAKALHFIHSYNVVHRDVKPANFLIRWPRGASRDRSYPDLILSDFGLAADKSAPNWTSRCTAGTPGYEAPESASPRYIVDKEADMWMLGCTAHHAIWRHRPRDKRPRAREGSPYSFNMYDCMMKMLEYKIDRRWTASEAVEKVGRYMSSVPFRALKR